MSPSERQERHENEIIDRAMSTWDKPQENADERDHDQEAKDEVIHREQDRNES